MKHANKPIAVILSLILALSVCAVAYAAPTVLGSGTCGKEGSDLFWSLTDDGVLTIWGQGEMKDYDPSIDDANFPPWKLLIQNRVLNGLGYTDFADAKADLTAGTADYAAYYDAAYTSLSFMTKIVLEEGVETVGDNAFYNMSVPEAELPSSLRAVGEQAFASNRLTHIDLPQRLSSLKSRAFADNDLTEATLSARIYDSYTYDVFADNESFQKLTFLSRFPFLTHTRIPSVDEDLPFTDFDTFAAYRDLKETVNLGKDVYNLNYNVGEVLGALMHQMNWTEAQARAMMTASETYQIRMAADKLGVDLNDPGAIAAKINSILGTSFTEAEIFMTGPVFVPDTALLYAVYPTGSNTSPTVYTDYMLVNYLGSCILIKNYSAQLFAGADPADVATIMNELYTDLAQLGVTASTPADAVSGILAKLNADLGLSGSDAYTEANAGTVETMRGDVSQDVKNAVLATFGTDRVNLDTEVRWYYGLNDDDTVGFQSSNPVIKPAPWFTLKVTCDSDDVDTLEDEGIILELVHGETAESAASGPTATEHGYTAGTQCTTCGRWVSGHETLHNTVEYEATEPTATEHGYTAGTYCTVCDTWITGHETVHNTLGDMTVLRSATIDEPGEAEIYCTVCGEKGLYAIEYRPPEQEEDEEPSGGSDNVILSGLRKALASFVNFFLRLIKWLGRA